MQEKNKVLCHWDLVRFIKEEQLIKEDGSFMTFSVTEGQNFELMIFLGKDDSSSEYEVKVYKSEKTDKYVPHDYDQVLRYEELDEYARFFLDDYYKARDFVEMLGYFHKEYQVRPVKKIKINN